jgi:hypothetical protein
MESEGSLPHLTSARHLPLSWASSIQLGRNNVSVRLGWSMKSEMFSQRNAKGILMGIWRIKTSLWTQHVLKQRFSNFFKVRTTFISQNVLRTTLLLSHLKANCLRFSTTVCDTQSTLILFILSFFLLMFNLRGPQGQNPRTTCGPRTTVWETLC